MFIVMFSSPSKYLVFRKKTSWPLPFSQDSTRQFPLVLLLQDLANRAIGQTLYILVRVQVNRVKINQNFMKWNLTPLIKCIWYNIYLSTHLNSSIIKKNGRLSAPPKNNIRTHFLKPNEPYHVRLKAGWTFCSSIHHHLSISSPPASLQCQLRHCGCTPGTSVRTANAKAV